MMMITIALVVVLAVGGVHDVHSHHMIGCQQQQL